MPPERDQASSPRRLPPRRPASVQKLPPRGGEMPRRRLLSQQAPSSSIRILKMAGKFMKIEAIVNAILFLLLWGAVIIAYFTDPTAYRPRSTFKVIYLDDVLFVFISVVFFAIPLLFQFLIYKSGVGLNPENEEVLE
ncbi:MAG: hypothetical protein R3C11_15180 [Planctomycetaceae bacterium]